MSPEYIVHRDLTPRYTIQRKKSYLAVVFPRILLIVIEGPGRILYRGTF